jgi:hypothetical protein
LNESLSTPQIADTFTGRSLTKIYNSDSRSDISKEFRLLVLFIGTEQSTRQLAKLGVLNLAIAQFFRCERQGRKTLMKQFLAETPLTGMNCASIPDTIADFGKERR